MDARQLHQVYWELMVHHCMSYSVHVVLQRVPWVSVFHCAKVVRVECRPADHVPWADLVVAAWYEDRREPLLELVDLHLMGELLVVEETLAPVGHAAYRPEVGEVVLVPVDRDLEDQTEARQGMSLFP